MSTDILSAFTPISVFLLLVALWTQPQDVAARAKARQTVQVELDALNKKICGRRLVAPPSQRSASDLIDAAYYEQDYQQDSEYSDDTGEPGTLTKRISAGRTAFPGEYPWFVQLEAIYLGKGSGTCGAVLIHKNLVLTAAHCVTSRKGQQPALIRLTSGVQTSKQQVLLVENRRIAPGFDHTNMGETRDYARVRVYDYALLLTQGEFQYDNFTQPICLPDVDAHMRNPVGCHAAGLGMIDDTKEKPLYPQFLQTIPMRASPAICPIMNADQICFISADPETYPGTPCPGDSGSALVCPDRPDLGHAARFYAIGVTSIGLPACHKGQVGWNGYTDIVLHRGNILELARILVSGEL